MKTKLLILFLLLFQKAYTQDYIVKGMAFAISYNWAGFYTVNIGFEKKIIKNIYFDLNINNSFTDGLSMGHEYKRIFPSFKFYINDKNSSIINNVWGNVLFRLSKESYGGSDDYTSEDAKGYGYGMGLGIGKKMYLTKKQRLFIDVGFTVCYGKLIYKQYDYSVYDGYGNIISTTYGHKPTYNFYYRPFVQLGYTIIPKTKEHTLEVP
jgi:hypothetical protein